MISPDDSERPRLFIDIDNNATVSDDDDNDADADANNQENDTKTNKPANDSRDDTTCLSPGCCSRFAALTGLDIHAIKRELEANKTPRSSQDDHQTPLPDRCHGRSAFEGGPDHKQLHAIEQKAMALNRVDGPDELFVGGVFALRRPGAMEAKGITHILSMIKYSFEDLQGFEDHYFHLSVDVDDVDDEDILVHLPRAVKFIEMGLTGGTGPWPEGTRLPSLKPKSEGTLDGESTQPETRQPHPDADTMDGSLADPSNSNSATRPGAVFVHCAMGKSRSITAALAYLLWKYPHRYGLTPSNIARPNEETAQKAVQAALDWVRKTREIAEPNPGFMKQLEMWVMMGMPADSDDAVEKNGTYQRWVWDREVEESARIGKKPDWLRFEDEVTQNQNEAGRELRCKKCRRVLTTQQFIIPHQKQVTGKQACPHHFVEALSWMRPILEEGELDGRLVCPNAKCGSSIGRYAWQGFKCSCGEWVCPAFSLGASKVDEVFTRRPMASSSGVDPRAAFGIRMPPGKQNL